MKKDTEIIPEPVIVPIPETLPEFPTIEPDEEDPWDVPVPVVEPGPKAIFKR